MHARTHAHVFRTDLEYLEEGKERDHISCPSTIHLHILMESFYIILLKKQKQNRESDQGCPTILHIWVINNVWRPMLIHSVWETAKTQVFFFFFLRDLCSALPFIKRSQVQWRTVRELSVGSDHWHKQSKLTQSSYSTCHSGNTNRSIWGELIHCLKLISLHPHHLPEHSDVKSACLIHINHSWQRKCLFEEPTWGKYTVSAECPLSKLAIWIFNRVVRRQMSLENPLHCNLYHFNVHFNSPLLREEVPGRVETH